MPFLIASHETLAVSTTAVSLTVPTPTPRSVTRAYIKVYDAAIRWRDDGTAPTASVGHREAAGDAFFLDGVTNLTNFKAIRKDSTNAELNIIYFREE